MIRDQHERRDAGSPGSPSAQLPTANGWDPMDGLGGPSRYGEQAQQKKYVGEDRVTPGTISARCQPEAPLIPATPLPAL